jgi:flavin reductase (DIM6/NTAB) family NADH-FMN oxidoreductase RutF
MISIKAAELNSMERFYRGNLINCISGFKPVSLIGTADEEGRHNLAVFSNIFHLGADPALIGFINRPRAAAPHTLSNIEATGVYTINHIQPSIAAQAHQTSAKYPEGCSEFEATGLEPEFLDEVKAPFVKGSPVKFSLQLEEVNPIKINGTYLVIGRINNIYLAEGLLEEDGFLALERASTLCSLGLDAYYTTAPLARYAYAKP